jgi:hypothetical protein
MLVPPSRQAPPPGQPDPAWRYDGEQVERVEPRGFEDLDGANYSVAVGPWLGEACRHWTDMARVLTAYVMLCALVGGLLNTGFSAVGVVTVGLTALPLAQGPMAVALAMVERRHWEFRELFAGFAGLPAFLGFFGVIGLLSAACFVPAVWAASWLDRMRAHQTPVDSGVEVALMLGAGLASLALLAALHARLATFGPQLILDRGCGPLAAIRGCWRLSRGHFWGLFGFNLLLVVINLVGLALCYVGVLLTLPLTQLAAAAAYLHAVGRLPGPPPRGDD